MEKKENVLKNYLKKEPIISAAVGLLVGIGLTCLIVLLFFTNKTIVKVNGKKITEKELYEKMKIGNGLTSTLSLTDALILDNKYTLTDSEKEAIVSEVDSAMEMYKDDLENFLAYYGCTSKEDLIKYLEVNEKSYKYIYDYLEAKLEPNAVQNYYNEHKDEIETYDSEHILVQIKDDVKDADALAMANEIISKLNEGKTFDDIDEEYGDKILRESLGYQGKDANLEQSYIDELVALEDGKYSQTPVKTSYGYHIVHRLSTATLEELRQSIIEELSADTISAEPNIYQKALIELRKENNFKILDEKLDKEYEKYCKTYVEE